MAKKEEIVKASTAPVLSNTDIPEHLRKYARQGSQGLENMKSEDMIMPRLSIAQAMSPQITKNDPLFIKGLEQGQLFNSLTNEIYGEGPVTIVPLFVFKSRIFFPPRGSDSPMLCQTQKIDADGRLVEGRITPEGCDICPHSQFLDKPRADGSTRPDCTLFYNYVMTVVKADGDILEPVAFSLKSKMIKTAKKFNSMMRLRNMPAFTMVFKLSSIPEKAPKGTFYNALIQPAGDVSEKLINRTESLFASLQKAQFNIDYRGVDKEDESEETPF